MGEGRPICQPTTMAFDLYPHRGFMLDTGRKFFAVQTILDLLDKLHENNFNVFHWHLHDSQSFPFPFPADLGLTNASIRHSHTREYYSQTDIQNVVAHGKQLGIMVYPETDVPGHSDIWGLWKEHLVVGKPDVKEPHAQLDIRTNNTEVYDNIESLYKTVDESFGSPVHHFGGDEVAYIWHTKDDNKLFHSFLNWLKTLAKDKDLILWDDPLTDDDKDIKLHKDWIIQTWHNGVTRSVLNKGHKVIVSEMDSFYIGNASASTISSFEFPRHRNVLGFEVVWFTADTDEDSDINQNWIMEPIRAASLLRRSLDFEDGGMFEQPHQHDDGCCIVS